MIDGVVLLNTYVEKEIINECFPTIGLVLIVFGVFGLIYFIDSRIVWPFITVCVIGFAVFLATCLPFNFRDVTYYQVSVDEEVPLAEFCKHYDTIKVEGEIWTIKMKDE